MNSSILGLKSLELSFDQMKLWDTLNEYRSTVSIAIIVILTLYKLLFMYREDEKEPKLIKPRIPIIGHALNVYRFGSRHFVGVA